MTRLALLLLLAALACKMMTGRWPWAFIGAAPNQNQDLFRARKLLGVSANASRTEIIEAHRNLIAIVHPDKGGTSDQVHEASDARDLLLAQLPDRP